MSEPHRITVASSVNPQLRNLLSKHPRIDAVAIGETLGIAFEQPGWQRGVLIGEPSSELYGIVEMIDNNPMVCADIVSTPGPAATLVLIALAPLIQAGLLVDAPVVMLNFSGSEEEIEPALHTIGWTEGAAIHIEPIDLGSVLTTTVMASIRTPDDVDEIDSLYEERFGHSFYVRQDDSSEWSPELVAGKPYAAYRLRISPDRPHSLLTIRVMADREGKCGAAQAVHAMNVMCGFEESLGVS